MPNNAVNLVDFAARCGGFLPKLGGSPQIWGGYSLDFLGRAEYKNDPKIHVLGIEFSIVSNLSWLGGSSF